MDPTATPTLTPTPLISWISTLPSGSYYEITRSLTVGDIAITGALMLVALLLVITFLWSFITQVTNRHGTNR